MDTQIPPLRYQIILLTIANDRRTRQRFVRYFAKVIRLTTAEVGTLHATYLVANNTGKVDHDLQQSKKED